MKKIFCKFYLDKEKDIKINVYKKNKDELEYILETPNHNTGNLITNLAQLCNLETIKNDKDMKIIKGVIPARINGDNETVYILKLGGIKIANIYEDGTVEIRYRIPAISKTLMSQTKNYNLPIEKTIIKSTLLKKEKFITDLHTHMNANLPPDILIALGIKRQIKYSLYFIKKLELKLTEKQEKEINKQREEIEKQYINSELQGKKLTRKIDDNTYINFADLILNNIQNVAYNIAKIRTSLSILKDGQAVFTNLEKVYLYRYVFCKGIESEEKIKITQKMIENISEREIIKVLKQMMKDGKKESTYYGNSLRQDKLLWIGRMLKNQGIEYTEIADTELTKPGLPAIKYLEEIHEIIPKIEKETGVKIRFIAAIRRIPLILGKNNYSGTKYLRECLNTVKAVGRDPYVVGSDFIGEEINDISDLQPVIKELVEYAVKYNPKFIIRIHAGENDSLKDNVLKSIQCVKQATPKGKKMPQIRIGHGLYTPNLDSSEGKALIKELKETKTIVEFQLTSNVRLNNLNKLENHPIKKYLKNGIKCVQGTDGCGIYGTNTIDEQLALRNLLGLNYEEFLKMREVEDEVIKESKKTFKEKSKEFEKFLNKRPLKEALLQLEKEITEESKNATEELRITHKVESEIELKQKVKELPIDKVPIIIAGGSFNTKGRTTNLEEAGKKLLKELIEKVDEKKVYFVIGHRMQGYEKEIFQIAKTLNKKIQVDAIIPKMITEQVKDQLLEENLDGVCVSIESEGQGIYKSFNYEIFERRSSVVIAFDGNSPVSNLVQEAKNGKGKSKIYINEEIPALQDKANSLEGYVIPFNMNQNIVNKIIEDNPEII